MRLKSPATPGHYKATFRFVDPESGQYFGAPLPVDIIVDVDARISPTLPAQPSRAIASTNEGDDTASENSEDATSPSSAWYITQQEKDAAQQERDAAIIRRFGQAYFDGENSLVKTFYNGRNPANLSVHEQLGNLYLDQLTMSGTIRPPDDSPSLLAAWNWCEKHVPERERLDHLFYAYQNLRLKNY